MSDPNTITSATEAKTLPAGQWAIDADGRKVCLVDTYMGWPQRMWMINKGRGYTALDGDYVTYPVRLGDFIGDCEHRWSHNECGHCRRCGQVVAEARPLTFAPEDQIIIRAAATHNARLLGEQP